MPRRREVPKREILPDPVYNSQLITKFINSLMIQGKKSVAEGVFYGALKKVEDRAKDDPLKLFKKAIDNVKPALEVKSRRVGGSNYQVPIEVRPSRRTALAIRWLISYAAIHKAGAGAVPTNVRLTARELAAIVAARLGGAREGWIITRHLLPSLVSLLEYRPKLATLNTSLVNSAC